MPRGHGGGLVCRKYGTRYGRALAPADHRLVNLQCECDDWLWGWRGELLFLRVVTVPITAGL